MRDRDDNDTTHGHARGHAGAVDDPVHASTSLSEAESDRAHEAAKAGSEPPKTTDVTDATDRGRFPVREGDTPGVNEAATQSDPPKPAVGDISETARKAADEHIRAQATIKAGMKATLQELLKAQIQRLRDGQSAEMLDAWAAYEVSQFDKTWALIKQGTGGQID